MKKRIEWVDICKGFVSNYAPLLIGKNIFKGKKKSDNIVETGIV